MEILLTAAWAVLWVLVLCLAYIFVGLLGSIIPLNAQYRHGKEFIDVYISSNGVHTDIVLPAVDALMDWREVLDDDAYAVPFSSYSYLGFGWGDKGFYLDTPTWAELSPKVAIRAMLWPTPTLMHVTSIPRLPADGAKHMESLSLTAEQYHHLCSYILSSFDRTSGDVQLRKGSGYTPNDNFYTAVGKYHAFNTCNFWVNRVLIQLGVRTSLWSPWDKGLFLQLRRAKTD
ncbi:MAG: TIGR02117 family protein [Bacteroidota bacterium]